MFLELEGALFRVQDIKIKDCEIIQYRPPIYDDPKDGYYCVRFQIGLWSYYSKKFKTKENAEDYFKKICDSIHYFLLAEKIERDLEGR